MLVKHQRCDRECEFIERRIYRLNIRIVGRYRRFAKPQSGRQAGFRQLAKIDGIAFPRAMHAKVTSGLCLNEDRPIRLQRVSFDREKLTYGLEILVRLFVHESIKKFLCCSFDKN